ncbi:polyhydroxyalkanoic acid system protein [Moraxella caviae]|uniref:Polyhydroxyalkanoic acid system protein n=1 Tax=Moraxella caviae TaxID=34060 RepID=A0A1T0AAY2_9GAMM|nr:polyhydroxyalkanoic acid system family protein [Moraxella caviae]OOR92818.1 polyhydroxyalkanoic acid system protein [Moraxella caviae]STZ14143.1 putative polyhydroxyalkanoic acid system protein [Moraxella caviae]VEW10456.1 putative polyhydroxyalkanoic acid system protein [Moraxella caviae]
MPDIYIEKSHQFDLNTARTQAKQWLAAAQSEFGVEADYQQGANSDTATIKKAGVTGRATLDADKIVFEADLAFFAKPLKSMIQSGIQDGLDRYFG